MATLAAFVENTVVTMFRAYVWLAVLNVRGNIRGFDASDVVTFAFVTQAIHASLQVTWDTPITERIRSGDIVTDLYRPVDLQLWWLAHESGRVAFSVLALGVPPIMVGSLLFDLSLPTTPSVWLLFAMSIALAFFLSYAWRFLVSCSGFWLLDGRGVTMLAGAAFTIASGSGVPLALMPTALGDALHWLPFAGMVQLPIEVLLQKGSALENLALQASWAVALLALGHVVLKRAERRLVVHGG
jgi:ABC-2 type transport system permease protein